MKKTAYSIAVDLGASDLKMAAVYLNGRDVHLLDNYVFPNCPINLGNGLYWDIFDLYRNILQGFSYFGSRYGKPDSIGFDSWGATYGFLDSQGRLAEPIFHYRDKRTSGVLEKLHDIIPKHKIFQLTGCQCASSYTLVQLYSLVLQKDMILSSAKHLVLLPDLLAYFMGGDLSSEQTIAGTTSMVEASQQGWCYELLDALHIPSNFLLPLNETGMIKGKLNSRLAEETGIGRTQIISAIGHDSAAAIEAIPGFDEDSLYVSLGTNVSMGIYRKKPALTEPFYLGGFKNTCGSNGRIVVYRDFPGAWILNNLCAEWRRGNTPLSYDDIDSIATQAAQSFIFNIESPLIHQINTRMSKVIVKLIKQTYQVSLSREVLIASSMDSIAMRVRYYALKLIEIRGKDFSSIWVISGAIRYKNLLSRIASALGRPIYAGLPYASLAGNAISQFYALGKLDRQSYSKQKSINPQFTEIQPIMSRDWGADMEWAIETKIIS